jgi:hypothetical protein
MMKSHAWCVRATCWRVIVKIQKADKVTNLRGTGSSSDHQVRPLAKSFRLRLPLSNEPALGTSCSFCKAHSLT